MTYRANLFCVAASVLLLGALANTGEDPETLLETDAAEAALLSDVKMAQIRGREACDNPGPGCLDYIYCFNEPPPTDPAELAEWLAECWTWDCKYPGSKNFNNSCEETGCMTSGSCDTPTTQYQNILFPWYLELAAKTWGPTLDTSQSMQCHWSMKCITGTLQADKNCVGRECVNPIGPVNGCRKCTLGPHIPGADLNQVYPEIVPCPFDCALGS